MNYILYYREANVFENTPAWMSKLGAMYRMHPMMINRLDDKKNENTFDTVTDAVKARPNCKWVFLDHRAETYLDEYQHPEDDVVYAIGSDYEGFEGFDISDYDSIKLRQEGEHYSAIVLQMVLYDRFLYLNGSRK